MLSRPCDPATVGPMRLRCSLYAIALILAGAASAREAAAQAIGVYHMPSTVGQYLGWGYGAGHHAPLICSAAQRPARSQRITTSPPCYGPLGPACYEPVGCYGPACSSHAPLYLQPPITATPVAPPTPRVAPASAIAPLQAPRHSPPVAMRPTPFGWR
jgi:hypothetical protein